MYSDFSLEFCLTTFVKHKLGYHFHQTLVIKLSVPDAIISHS